MIMTPSSSSLKGASRKHHRRCRTDPSLLEGISATMKIAGEEEASDYSSSSCEDVRSLPASCLSPPTKIAKTSPTATAALRQSASMTCLSVYFGEEDRRNCSSHDVVPEKETPTVATAAPQQSPHEESRNDTPSPSQPNSQRSMEEVLQDTLEAIECSEWASVYQMIEAYPSLVRQDVSMVIQGETTRCLLVHVLCGLVDTPLTILELVVTLHPRALLQADSRGGRLALHIAVIKNAHVELVKYLCQARSQALQVPDQDGNLPLHYAAMYGSSPQVLHVLMQAYPEACAHRNKRDRYPIHLLCAQCYSTSTAPVVSTQDIQAMIMAYPKALTQVDRLGRTPLHLACSTGTTTATTNSNSMQWELLQVLIQHAPEALLQMDKARKIPYQRAITTKGHGKGRGAGTDLVLASLWEATQAERKRQNKKRWSFLSGGRHNSSSSSNSVTSSSSSRHRGRPHPTSQRDDASSSPSCLEDDVQSQGTTSKELYCCYG